MDQFAADPPVEARVGEALRSAGDTVAVAESCTGGLVGALLTAVPGASDYVDRGAITYTYDSKLSLGVSREALDAHGAVSAPVAREMARRVRDAAGADWGLATTGVAGPTGGSEETPVGTAYVGLARAGDWGTGETHTATRHVRVDGDRAAVRERIAREALEALRVGVRRHA